MLALTLDWRWLGSAAARLRLGSARLGITETQEIPFRHVRTRHDAPGFPGIRARQRHRPKRYS
ncbi:hypothetical protein [Rhodoglobus vestalii]|uniref:hypothetical protein n=1 Tax=Rhodoglobus vestalii TaxID=193384 RepID=UPI0011508C47|nr:hypothetical protein [Rhodoglobus vestalii]